MKGRFFLGLSVVVASLAASPTNQRLLLVLLTSTAIYLGYRLQIGSHET